MALPDIEQHRVDKLFSQFCNDRIPLHSKDQVKLVYRMAGNKVILIESRPFSKDPTRWTEMPMAQFEYNVVSGEWGLFGYDINSKRMYVLKGSLDRLIQEVDKDPAGIFWK